MFLRTSLLIAVAMVFTACATVPSDMPKTSSRAIIDTSETHFGLAAEQWANLHDGQSGFFPLVNGMDALGVRLDMIEKAEKAIDLQYFLMKDDKAGMILASALIAAADRGVRIRFLLDDVFTSASDQTLLLMSQHSNVEVRLFNPVSRRGLHAVNFVGSFKTANRRMHNKSFTVDSAISIVGGRNIADEYFQLKGDSVFSDFDILAFGEVAKVVSGSFDIYWNHSLAIPIEQLLDAASPGSLDVEGSSMFAEAAEQHADIYKEALSSEILQDLISGQQPLFPAHAVIVADDPDKLRNPVGPEYMGVAADVDQLLRQSEHELIFISPYYVPGDDGVQYTRAIVEKGVRVVVVTNSLASNNHVAVHSAYSGYRKDVLNAGVELYEVRADAGKEIQGGDGPDALTLHTKLILVDRRFLFVGSLNLDPRSLEINAEMGLLIDSPELVRLMAEGIERDISAVAYKLELGDNGGVEWHWSADDQKFVETSEPMASRWLRFKAWFLKIAPESQL